MRKVLGLLVMCLLCGCTFRLEIEISRSKPEKEEEKEFEGPELKLFRLPLNPMFKLPKAPLDHSDPPGMPPLELPEWMKPKKKKVPKIVPGPNTVLLLDSDLELPKYF